MRIYSVGFVGSVSNQQSIVRTHVPTDRPGLNPASLSYIPGPHSSCSDLTEPIDVYSAWIDAADAAQREIDAEERRRYASGSRPRQRVEGSDEE